MVECPKCGSKAAWLEQMGLDTVLRCLCGQCRIIATRPDGTGVVKKAAVEIRLPRRGTKLWYCLAMLVGLEQAFLGEITERLLLSERTRRYRMPSQEVSGYLTVLRYKCLALRLERRQRLPGGSLWAATDEAMKLFEEVYNARTSRPARRSDIHRSLSASNPHTHV